MTAEPVIGFRERSLEWIGSDRVGAIQRGTDRFTNHRTEAVEDFPEMDDMRNRAQAIRHQVLSSLNSYVEQFTASVEAAGGVVHLATDADEAREVIARLVEGKQGRPIIKSKSMVTEELHLNPFLEKLGHEVVETDLGEFIIQLAEEPPVHIIAPALDRTRQEIGRLFSDRLGVAYTEVPTELNQIAREHLRDIFLRAGVGITGVNFGVAETGSIVTVTNEGNGRLTSTTPPLHIAVMGIERLVPGLEDLEVMLEVLARSATGQRLSVYSNIVTGPRRLSEPDGPDEAPCGDRRQWPQESARDRARRGPGLHSLRRLPQRVSGVSTRRRSLLRFGLPRPSGGSAFARSFRARGSR